MGSDDVVDKIMRTLEPIDFEKFHLLTVKVGLAVTTSQARVKREKKKALQDIVDGVDSILGQAEATVTELEKKLSSQRSGKDGTAGQFARLNLDITRSTAPCSK